VALALDAGEVVPTARLVDALWGERLPADPGNALQAVASRLRRALAAGGPDGADLVKARPAGYVLAVDRDAVDAHRFERLAARGRAALAAGAAREAAAALAAALATWRGPPLAGVADVVDDAVTRGHAARLAELRLAATEDHAEAQLALAAGGDERGLGAAAQAELARLAAELEPVVTANPLRERLQALLMRALYGAGRQADALAAYRRAREALADLGLDPGPELRRVERAVLAQDPALTVPEPVAPPPAAPVAPPAPAERRPGNLPEPLTSFVGRDGALATVLGMVGSARLVTLTGPGGAGKTRLAVEAARRRLAAGADPDGAWLVELAALRDPSSVASAALDALRARAGPAGGSRPGGQAPPLDAGGRLLEFLEHKRLLLVLDNCEHLVDAAADLAATILAACPGVRILATSREALRVTGEARWPVPALAVPPAGAAAAEVGGYEAVRLFAERAAAAASGFAVGGGNAATVAEVCRRLDGLPLAIELAAARAGSLGVETVAARLGDRFRLLTGGSRAALPRQQTLRAVVEWSWDLLGERERLVLARLSAFAGGCTIDAAEEVVADDGDGDAGGLDRADVLDAVGNLVDKSLLVTGQDAGGGGLRYHLLETVQAYAAERLLDLGGDAAEAASRRHAAWCAGLAEASVPGLRGRDQVGWMRRLEAERENLRAALAWSVGGGDVETALRLAGGLGWFWWQRGYRDEAKTWLTRALALDGRAYPAALGVATLYGAFTSDWTDQASVEALRRPIAEAERLLAAAGDVHNQVLASITQSSFESWDEPDGLVLFDKALALLGPDGDPWHVAIVRLFRSIVLARIGRFDDGRAEAEASLAIYHAIGDRWGRTQVLGVLAYEAEVRGDYGAGIALLDEAVAASSELGLREVVMMTLAHRGNLETLLGRFDAAAASNAEALALATELGSTGGAAFAHSGAGLLAQRRGDLDRAREAYEAALAIYRRLRFPQGLAPTLTWLGFLAERRGDAPAALALQREALDSARQAGDPRSVAFAVEGLASAAVAAEDAERAALLLGVAATLRASVNAPLPAGERVDVERIERAACAAIGTARVAAAIRRGAALPPGDADALIDAERDAERDAEPDVERGGGPGA